MSDDETIPDGDIAGYLGDRYDAKVETVTDHDTASPDAGDPRYDAIAKHQAEHYADIEREYKVYLRVTEWSLEIRHYDNGEWGGVVNCGSHRTIEWRSDSLTDVCDRIDVSLRTTIDQINYHLED